MPINKPFTVTVTQLNRKISFMLSGEKSFADLCVRGEISNLTINARSGHIYFTLKDENSSVRGVMFSDRADKLSFVPEAGMSVVVRGSVKCYERDGVYQIYAAEMTRAGAGALAEEFEKLKARLNAEGLFSQKREIPKIPDKICVITSETGAVLQDIRNVLSRRWPQVKVILIPAAVQGDTAPASLVSAFEKADTTDADVIIFGRGGGSAEDLSCFNSEAVARAIFGSRIPTISAVGHETDFTIADLTADKRAPTPSAAAELAVPDKDEVISALSDKKRAIGQQLYRVIEKKTAAMRIIGSEIRAKSPVQRLKTDEQKLIGVSDAIRSKMSVITFRYGSRVDALESSVRIRMHSLLDTKERSFVNTAAVIEALNPLAVLLRGYSITYRDGKAVVSAEEVKSGDTVKIRLSDGEITAEVKDSAKFEK
ncbi:MAG: exodeoxyribonuclease VII large subunit [Ruminiclostridium sp.]|nr:exodeoxyribonuclease VII large subunit [Ruminiclostridium sp.]